MISSSVQLALSHILCQKQKAKEPLMQHIQKMFRIKEYEQHHLSCSQGKAKPCHAYDTTVGPPV
uniref:Uncharacterized protein n=1 Tax=Arundo donax TaxID=35708 RepID=A0A0A8Z5W0_ARUDO